MEIHTNFKHTRSQNSSVGIVTTLHIIRLKLGLSFGTDKSFFHLHITQIGSEAHRASYSMGSEGSISRGGCIKQLDH